MPFDAMQPWRCVAYYCVDGTRSCQHSCGLAPLHGTVPRSGACRANPMCRPALRAPGCRVILSRLPCLPFQMARDFDAAMTQHSLLLVRWTARVECSSTCSANERAMTGRRHVAKHEENFMTCSDHAGYRAASWHGLKCNSPCFECCSEI